MKARISSLKAVFIQSAKSTQRDQKPREKKSHNRNNDIEETEMEVIEKDFNITMIFMLKKFKNSMENLVQTNANAKDKMKIL